MRVLVSILTILISSLEISAAPIQSAKLISNPEYYNVQISPDGKYISAVYLSKKLRNISIINIDSQTIDMEFELGLDSRVLNYQWLSKDQIYLKVRYDNKSAIFIGKLKDKKIDLKHVNVNGYLVDVYPENEEEIIFAKRYRDNSYDVHKIKIGDFIQNNFSDSVEVDTDEDSDRLFSYDEVSKKILTSRYDSDSKIWTILAATFEDGDWETILQKKSDDFKFFNPVLLGENRLAVLTNQETDKVVLQIFNTQTNEFEEILYQHPKYDLKSAVFGKDGKLHRISYEHQGLTQFEFFNPVSKKLDQRLAKTFKGAEYFLIDLSKDKTRAIIQVKGANRPGEYLVFDSKQDVLKNMLASYPELESETLFPSQTIITKSSDGVEIEAFLTQPSKKNDLYTLLVMPHGGPIGVKDDDRFNPEVQYLASRGFTVLRVNFRGSEGFGKDFKKQGVGQFGKLIEDDIALVVKKVRKNKKYRKMCSIGTSYGGYSSVMLAIRQPKLYDCVVARFGVYDLPLIFNHDNNIERNEKRWSKVVGKNSPELYDVSPVYFAEKLNAPILLTAGKEDETAVFEHTYRMEYVLKKNKHDVEKFYYENTAHGHYNFFNRRHELAVIYDFLIRKLNLNFPSKKHLSEESKKALADDFAYIADMYSQDKDPAHDEKKALEYYKVAASYDHPRANFNVGSYYHRGEVVDKNLAETIKYYKQAAKLDFASAHRRLGRMYMEGDYLDLDWSKAKYHLEQALKLDDSPESYFRLARFDCTAPNEHRDLDRCLKAMKMKKFERISKLVHNKAIRQLRIVAPWIITETDFNPEERKQFEEILNSTFELNEMEVGLESVKAGAFEFVEGIGYGNYDKYENVSEGSIVKYSDNKEHYFGMVFGVDIPGIDGRDDKVGIAARWIRNMKDGSKKYPSAIVLYGAPQGDWRLLRNYEDFESAESVTLEIFDLRGKKLLSREFFLKES